MAISVTNFKCARCLADGTVKNDGTYLKAFITFTSDNFAYYTLEYRRDSEESWTQITNDNVYYFDGTYTSTSAILDYEYSYDFRLTVTDSTETAVKMAYLPTGFVLLDFNASGKSIAFGKVSENANAMEIAMDMLDRYGTMFCNGKAFYETEGSTDIDTSSEELILASVSALGGLYFIRQMFYSTKSATSNRVQVAYPYNKTGSSYYRYYNSGSWSAWIENVVTIESGTSGIWTYRKYSDNTAECFGKISITDAQAASSIGNWYRSAQLYTATDYPYPVTFTEAPAVEMMFQTTNQNDGLLWLFSQSNAQALSYLPTGYIIRPTTATGINGNINIIAKGKI